MPSPKNTPSPTQMEEYRRQLLEMSRRATTPEENWLDTHFPAPDIEKDKAAMAPPTEEPAPPTEEEPAPPTEEEPAPPIAETPFVGYLRIFTYTADEAEPLEGARVVVSREGTLYANTVTDRDGYTPVIALPTVDPALSLQPGLVQPYIAYSIEVQQDGFQPIQYKNVPVYGNTYVTQPVALLPLLPNANPNLMQDFTSGGPANL